MVNFCSDNATGVAPEILRALEAANTGAAMPYGNDDLTRGLQTKFNDLFETDVSVYPVATGTAANVLALASMVPTYGVIYCHEHAHINVDECGGTEFYTGGAKLHALPGSGGKITPDAVKDAMTGVGDAHHAQPAAISLTQTSESGTVYSLGEIAAMAEAARGHGLKLHMDGARFANAVVSLGCSPAEATWKAGVDVLSFGATKNGVLGAEAVVFFQRDLAESFKYRRMRGGHLVSKMRFLSAQLHAYLDDGLWLRHARHANAMAARMAEGLAALDGVTILYPVQANEIFAQLPAATIQGLLKRGFLFYRWGPEAACEIRLVTAFNTPQADVDAFLDAARALAG